MIGERAPQQLSSLPDGAANPVWSPDGSRIAFIGNVISDPEAIVDDPRPPDSREVVRRAPIARIARRLDYKHDGSGFVDGRYHHPFMVPAACAQAYPLTNRAGGDNGVRLEP